MCRLNDVNVITIVVLLLLFGNRTMNQLLTPCQNRADENNVTTGYEISLMAPKSSILGRFQQKDVIYANVDTVVRYGENAIPFPVPQRSIYLSIVDQQASH